MKNEDGNSKLVEIVSVVDVDDDDEKQVCNIFFADLEAEA